MKLFTKNNTTFILAFITCFICCKESKDPHTLEVGQDAIRPILFSDGKITTTNGINFTKDGNTIYISNPINRKSKTENSFSAIFKCAYVNGEWGDPEQVNFGIDAYHPVLSHDNNLLLFNSRSHPDTTDKFIKHNIWYSKRKNGDWSHPELLDGINSSFYDSYPSLAMNKNLYFNSDRPGGKGQMDIYFSEFEEGLYNQPINLFSINSVHSENDLVIDPNERFIIFNRYIDSTKSIDLYISFKQKENWSIPEKIDLINSNESWELTPTISADLEYFFYEVDNQILQVKLNAILNDHKKNEW